MNIVSLNIMDMGGLSYNLCKAINELTPHHAISLVAGRSFTRKPIMVEPSEWLKKEPRRKLEQFIKNADVLHFNEFWTSDCFQRLIKRWNINPANHQNAKVIFHAHGSRFRRSSSILKQQFCHAFPQVKLITSTPDLLDYNWKGKWFPSIVPIEQYRRQYQIKRNEPPVIYYSPTQSSGKAEREVIEQASQQLRKEGLKFELKIVTGVHHKVNMQQKSKADIYYNEMRIFYGINAIEAGAFEMPVICGMNKFVKAYIISHKIRPPLLVANNPTQLVQVLRKLIMDRPYREQLGKANYEYVTKMHSPEVCIKRFLALIE